MNHLILEQLKNLKTNPQLKRKFKIFLGVGLTGFLVVCALVVWAGIATFKNVASSVGANPVVQEKIKSWNDSNLQEKIGSLETGVKNLPALAKAGCWTTAQSLMKVQAWIEKPVAENVNSLKVACLNK